MDRLETLAARLPHAYPGPGGAIAVLRAGEVLLRHVWGYANAERRIAFTPRTLFRMCSITKQFTCAAVLDACGDPAVLDPLIRARLPLLGDAVPGARHLMHNQSGLRDYWAVAMLHGAPVESAFGDTEAARVIAGTASLHFAPGARYSYVNQNFRLLSDALQDHAGAQLRRAAARPHLRPRRHGQRLPRRRYPRHAGRHRGLRGQRRRRLPRRGEPHPLDRGRRFGRLARRHDRLGAPHRRDTR
jgi:CubicO group peptidase (beta-lactamase class C family)